MPMLYHKSLTLPNDLHAIPELTAFIDAACEVTSFDDDMVLKMNLAIEEAVVNVISYAYPEGTQGKVEVTITVDITLPAEKRPIGGLGIFLVRQLMDSVSYERRNGENILTLMKALPQENKNQ